MESSIATFENLKLVPILHLLNSERFEIENIQFPIKEYFTTLRERATLGKEIDYLQYVASVNHLEAIDLVSNKALKKMDKSYLSTIAIPMMDDSILVGEVEVIKRLNGKVTLLGDPTEIYEVRINCSDNFFEKNPDDGRPFPNFYVRFFFFLDSKNEIKLLYDFLDKTKMDKKSGNFQTDEKAKQGVAIKQCYNKRADDFKIYLKETFEYDKYEQ